MQQGQVVERIGPIWPASLKSCNGMKQEWDSSRLLKGAAWRLGEKLDWITILTGFVTRARPHPGRNCNRMVNGFSPAGSPSCESDPE
jgi:hypothetical protein